MRFPQKKKERTYIPTASMADIAFLLIVFFMVTTIFRVEKGIKVELPQATTTERLPKRNVARVWVNKAGDISVDDKFMEVSEVEIVMAEKLNENPDMLVQIKGDKDTRYGDVAWILEELKKARAIKVSLASKEER
jgi:biopolymer transport protein ExbD